MFDTSYAVPLPVKGGVSVNVNDLDGTMYMSVPLRVPLGTAGMQPRLSLSFSSSGGLSLSLSLSLCLSLSLSLSHSDILTLSFSLSLARSLVL